MGSICVSSATILRCSSLTQIQNIVLIIPTVLEVIFSTSLVFMKWGSGRRHLLLTAEGWIYLALALLELLSNVVPAVRGNFPLFRGLDLGIGVASFLPIFFYTFFLFLFTKEELIETLPNRVKNVAKLTLVLFIPAIVIFNEVASFVGVEIRSLPEGKASSGTLNNSVIAIGFTSKQNESLWSFFTSLTLAVLIAFQAAIFCFAFFRLAQALLHQRRIESKGDDQAHLVKGVGWISGAAKLGALETVIGFAGGGYSIALTRRILRLLARACLSIGIVKGVDVIEDFRAVRSEMLLSAEKGTARDRRSRLHQLISNPRFSTFRSLSPTAATFHAAPRAAPVYPFTTTMSEKSSPGMKSPHYQTYTQRQSQLMMEKGVGLPGMAQFANIKEKNTSQRVTVHYNDGAPMLQMRFSMLEMPSPAVIVERVKSRPPSEWSVEEYRKTRSDYPGFSRSGTPYTFNEKENLEKEAQADFPVPRPYFHNVPASDSLRDSLNSQAPSMNGPFEIVTIPRRTFSQRRAQATVLQTPTTTLGDNNDISSESPTTMSPQSTLAEMTFKAPTPVPVRSRAVETRQAESADMRVKSMSVKSMSDSIQAVRELAGQFPGLPMTSLVERRPSSIVWKDANDDNESVVDYPPNIVVAQAVGSPSELQFKIQNRARLSHITDSTTTWGNANSRRSSGVIFANSAPGQGNQLEVPALPAGGRAYAQKSLDPFADDDEESDYKPSSQPIIAPVGKPLRESLGITTAMASATHLRDLSSAPGHASGNTTPATALSTFTQYNPIAMDGMPTTEDDVFLDLGTALDTGKSRQFTPTQLPLSQSQPAVQPMPSIRRNQSSEKLARIAEWVDTSASAEIARLQAAAEGKTPSPVTVGQDTSRPLQDLHARGMSIDNLTIPWLKDSNMMEEDERKLAKAMNTKRPYLGRLKSVGNVSQRSTPTPIYTPHTRASTHLEPLVIPPRNVNMPEAVQPEYGSLESTSTGRGMLRDSEVLGMADSIYVTQNTRSAKQPGNYF